ncbi:HAD family hydrolase [Acinetobacter sp. B10A]|uniref:HAD family hydrolase n=1 Tax=Acinetobacter baretiae TaxID=2605383 RepID=UPI001B3C6E2F|nr:HAD family hydrolase [Acinetobacter baretiae]MBF7684402.1 HAD family hydrolase [Acinetobacter baretiae]
MKICRKPSVIVFDVFGTLVKIKKKCSPYKKLLRVLNQQGRVPQANDVSVIMSTCADFSQLAHIFGYDLPTKVLHELQADLEEELASICLYEDTLDTLADLKAKGFKLAVCSNLALPYGDTVLKKLPMLDAYIWSYEVGVTKPNPQIYQHVVKMLNCQAEDVLFIGDTPKADVVGPTSFGMSARLIQRRQGQTLLHVIDDFYSKP